MSKILDWRKSDDPRDLVHLAVQAIAEGHIVALPSSSAYLLVASGLKKQAVQQLEGIERNDPGFGLSLIARSADETLDYFPDVTPAARRLAKKSWPNPVVFKLKDAHASSVLRCLDPAVCSALHQGSDRISVWQPKHQVLDHVCKLSSGPLICALAMNASHHVAMDIASIPSGRYVLAIDSGSIEEVGEPTVVDIDENRGRIVHPGIVREQDLKTLNQWTVLFVCTGNTCRSPMAQAMMQRKLAERFPKLVQGDSTAVVALSAGVSAFGGDPASHGACAAIRTFGATLDHHQSTQLNSELVEQADLILAMGSRHRQVILSQWPSVAAKVHLISPDGGEISDPFGGPLEMYQRCALQLDQYTTYWIDRLDLNSLIQWQPSQ